MVTIHDDTLAAVTGAGESSIKVETPLGGGEQKQTDYRLCVETMTKLTAQQHPNTKLFGIFGNDDNATRRAEATMQNIGKYCGPPP